MEAIDIKRMGDKFNMHTFLAYYVSLLLMMVMILNRVPSLQCFYVFIKFCFNS